jgi:FtsH-binding integral membrane protein
MEAVVFLLAALLHLGVQLPVGFTVLAEPQIMPAVIVEGLCALFLAVSAYALFTRRPWAWTVTTAAYAFALAGMILGMVALAAGWGPRTETNDLYQRVMLMMLVAGLVLLATLDRNKPALPSR